MLESKDRKTEEGEEKLTDDSDPDRRKTTQPGTQSSSPSYQANTDTRSTATATEMYQQKAKKAQHNHTRPRRPPPRSFLDGTCPPSPGSRRKMSLRATKRSRQSGIPSEKSSLGWQTTQWCSSGCSACAACSAVRASTPRSGSGPSRWGRRVCSRMCLAR